MIKAIYKSIVSERTRTNLLYALAKLTTIFYKGNSIFCNCCGRSFSRFRSFGSPPRLNALCPYCLSLERTRVLKYYLEKEVFSKSSSLSVLHFAPEKGIEDYIKNNSNMYVSADISDQVADIVVDISNMQFEDSSFDLVLCSHVLAHVEDEVKAIDEIIRVLKPTGKAILLTAIYQSETTQEDLNANSPAKKMASLGRDDIWRKHGKDFVQRIKRETVKVSEIDYRDKLGIELVKKYALGHSTREKLYILEKI